MELFQPGLIALCLIGGAGATSAQNIANGNRPLNMDVNEMDANHDGVVTKAEFGVYGEKIWALISHGTSKVPVDSASTAIATGNMSLNVNQMDADRDGFITHDEFIAYCSREFDKVKSPKGDLSLSDVTKYFASGGRKTD